MKKTWTGRDLRRTSEDEIIQETENLIGRIKPILRDRHPSATGACLAELVATLIAGHHPDLREPILTSTVALINRRIPSIVEKMIGEDKAPPEWRGETKQ